MTHPDPALNYAAQPAAETPAETSAGVLSETSETVRGVQEMVIGRVDRITPARRHVEEVGGARFRLRTLISLMGIPLKSLQPQNLMAEFSSVVQEKDIVREGDPGNADAETN